MTDSEAVVEDGSPENGSPENGSPENGSPRDGEKVEPYEDIIAEEYARTPVKTGISVDPVSSAISLSSPAPDAQLKGMKVIFQKELPKISVDRYYLTFWEEEANRFFESWLVADGKSKVEVGPWTSSDENGEEGQIVNPYDEETYDQVRTISYSYDRSTSVYSGLVSVAMTQYCRRLKRSICVVSSTLQLSGMPYAKSFRVHIRWVASRQKQVNLRIQVGLNVVFLEQVLVASQIKANTMHEMTQAQLGLFRSMKNALGFSEANLKDAETIREEQHPVRRGLAVLFPFVNSVTSSKNDARIKVEEAKTKLARVRALRMKELANDIEEQRQHIVDEFDAVQVALDAILLRMYANEASTPVSSTDVDLPDVAKLFVRMGNGVQSMWDTIMRKINPRRISVREPSLFVKKDADQIDPPKRDDTLTKMEVIVSSVIQDVTLQDFVDIFLTDEQGQDGFYADWLSQTDRSNIEICSWEDEDEHENPFVDDFSGESFARRRTIKATFDKAQLLRDGSTSGESTQTQDQFYRMDDDQRLVLATTTKVQNIPFADSFEIHTRWVVTQLQKSLMVKVGLFALFKKQAMLEPKIRAGATKEGRRTQLDLFLKVRAALGKVNEARTLAQIVALEESLTPTPQLVDVVASPLHICSPRTLSDLLEGDSTLHEEFENAKLKLRAVEGFIKKWEVSKDLEAMKFSLGELNVVNDALDNIVDWHGDAGESSALVEASLM